MTAGPLTRNAAPAGRIRVGIVDDDELVRASLTMLLSAAPDIEVIGEACAGAEVGTLVDAHRPDVVLMDIRMPGVDGPTATKALRSRPDAPEMIVLTTSAADECVLGALRAGASGFLLKDTPPLDIVQAVRKVAAREAMLSPAVTRQLIEHITSHDDAVQVAAAARLSVLNNREQDVALALGPRPVERGDRRGTVHERRDGQGLRLAAPDETRREQPGAGRAAGARRRALLTGDDV